MANYVIFADEAWTHDPGLRYWRFYGGALVRADRREAIENDLATYKAELGLQGETKWSRLRPFMRERIHLLLDRFFEHVAAGEIKLRYMWIDHFKQNPSNLNEFHAEYGYYILYYHFVVSAFGLPWHDEPEPVNIELLADQLPDEPQKKREFTAFLKGCHRAQKYRGKSPFRIIGVGDFDSRKHVISQCVDDVIGSAGFRLNDFHREKQPNGRRAPGTRYKEGVYKHICKRLGAIDAAERGSRHYSVGVNTSRGDSMTNIWTHNFRQWDFARPGVFNREWLDR